MHSCYARMTSIYKCRINNIYVCTYNQLATPMHHNPTPTTKAPAPHQGLLRAEVMSVFDALDTDRSGSISFDEFSSWCALTNADTITAHSLTHSLVHLSLLNP